MTDTTDYKALCLKLTERFENTINMMHCEIKEKDKLLLDKQIEIDTYHHKLGDLEIKEIEIGELEKRIEDLILEVELKKLCCGEFQKQITELEETIKQQEISIKIYKDNDAEGLSEFCEKVNEDLEKLQDKYNELEEEKNNKDEEAINCRNALKDLFCECVRISPDAELMEDESIKLENLWYEKDYSELLVEVIEEMNEDDWNEDDGMCQFNITVLDGGSHGQKVVRIELVMNDGDDD